MLRTYTIRRDRLGDRCVRFWPLSEYTATYAYGRRRADGALAACITDDDDGPCCWPI